MSIWWIDKLGSKIFSFGSPNRRQFFKRWAITLYSFYERSQLRWPECLCLPKLCWNPNSQGDGISRWGLQEEIRSWIGFVLLFKTPQRALSPSCHVRAWREPEKGLSLDVKSASSLILDFAASRTNEKCVCCLSYKSVVLLLSQPEPIKTVIEEWVCNLAIIFSLGPGME